MDINSLLRGVDCKCGRKHTCDIRYVYIEKDAVSRLCTLCEGYDNILLVSDEDSYNAAGGKVMRALEGKTVEKLILEGGGKLRPDENAVAAVNEKLKGCSLIIGVGSGVIQDLCKFTSFKNSLPYYIVATAPSMDGYASSVAAMTEGGMKITHSAKVPDAIIADTGILKDAPVDLIKAGYGDIIGKISSLLDWKLSHIVTGEYFCEYIHDLVSDVTERVISLTDSLAKRDEDSIKALMEALIVSGIAMSFAGSSRPASGSEHHLAHFFEVTSAAEGTDGFAHGIDVAFGAIITTGLRERILQNGIPEPCKPLSREQYESEMRRVYGKMAESCIALQDKAGFYKQDRIALYKQHEAQITELFRTSPSATRIDRTIAKMGLNIFDFYEKYGHRKVTDAIKYAKDLKDRYTILWMYYDLFGTDYQY